MSCYIPAEGSVDRGRNLQAPRWPDQSLLPRPPRLIGGCRRGISSHPAILCGHLCSEWQQKVSVNPRETGSLLLADMETHAWDVPAKSCTSCASGLLSGFLGLQLIGGKSCSLGLGGGSVAVGTVDVTFTSFSSASACTHAETVSTDSLKCIVDMRKCRSRKTVELPAFQCGCSACGARATAHRAAVS